MQTVNAQFDALSKGYVRPISYGLRISFDKTFDPALTFFTLDESVLDGPDILAPSDGNVLQEWDRYNYADYSSRPLNSEVSREIDFPYSVAAAVADFELNNYDALFTPNSGSSIAPFVLPSRPLRIFMGFNNSNLQQFVGLTEFLPEVDDSTKTVSFHAIDFLSKIFTLKTPNLLAMQDVRTDEVLSALFEAAGLLPTQYSLGKGRNKIKFLYFEKGVTYGYVMEKLMEAEMGLLWLDETGIIRFSPRIEIDQTAVMSFDDENIIDIRTANAGRIINVVEINATIREVQATQPIFLLSDGTTDEYIIPANSSKDIWSRLEDPTITVITPTPGENTDTSFYVATDLSGNIVGSTAINSTSLFVDTYKINFQNNNAFPIRISALTLWGDPAKIIDEIKYTEKNQASIDKYEERGIVIDNDFVQSVDACDSIALSLLDSYAEYSGDIEMSVKGTPALQLGDYIEVTKSTFTGNYKVTKLVNRILDGKFEQIIGARRFKERSYFILSSDTIAKSLLDGTDVLAP